MSTSENATLVFVHESDHEFAPGDLIRPAAETGHASKHTAVPGYDPTLVYVSLPSVEILGRHGRFAYLVEPLTPVGPDAEVEHWKRHYRAQDAAGEPWWEDFGAEEGEPWHDNYLGDALTARTTTAARVVQRL